MFTSCRHIYICMYVCMYVCGTFSLKTELKFRAIPPPWSIHPSIYPFIHPWVSWLTSPELPWRSVNELEEGIMKTTQFLWNCKVSEPEAWKLNEHKWEAPRGAFKAFTLHIPALSEMSSKFLYPTWLFLNNSCCCTLGAFTPSNVNNYNRKANPI
jgi:hypothetical protein